MSAPAAQARSAGSDRFEIPSTEILIGDIVNAPLASLFEEARTRLIAEAGLHELLNWHGLPWRWALSYWSSKDADRADAFLIPDPVTPKIAIPLTRDAVPQLSMRRLSKSAREAVIFAPSVDGIRWVQMDLTAKSVIDDARGMMQAAASAALARV